MGSAEGRRGAATGDMITLQGEDHAGKIAWFAGKRPLTSPTLGRAERYGTGRTRPIGARGLRERTVVHPSQGAMTITDSAGCTAHRAEKPLTTQRKVANQGLTVHVR